MGRKKHFYSKPGLSIFRGRAKGKIEGRCQTYSVEISLEGRSDESENNGNRGCCKRYHQPRLRKERGGEKLFLFFGLEFLEASLTLLHFSRVRQEFVGRESDRLQIPQIKRRGLAKSERRRLMSGEVNAHQPR
jgi:hypothetical protein